MFGVRADGLEAERPLALLASAYRDAGADR